MTQLVPIAALACALPVCAWAQAEDAGGMRLTFDVQQRLEATTNRDLTDTTDDPGWQATTTLGFGFLDETRTETLSFDLATGVRITEDGSEASDPRAAFAYSRTSADAALAVSANWTRTDIAFLRDAEDFITADGTLVLPEDFDDLIGSGTRTLRSAEASLRWGETAPLGYSLSARLTEVDYDNANASLLDSQRLTLGAGLRLRIDDVTRASIGVSHTTFEEEGSATEDSTRLTFGVTRARPLGDISAQVSATREDDGDTRLGFSVGRSYALPTAVLDARLGLTQDGDGGADLTGRLSYQQDLPDAQIRLAASRSLSTGAGDDRRTTVLQAGYTRRITPVSSLQLGFDYAEATEDGDSLATGSLSASYGVRITPDWQMNLGLRQDLRRDDGTTTRAATAFVTLGRSFTFRP